MNHSFSLLKIFFDEDRSNYSDDLIFQIINKIDISYSISNNTINFDKFDRINAEKVKDLIGIEKEKQNLISQNKITKLFFIIHLILSYFIKTLDDEYAKIANQLNEMFRANLINDPRLYNKLNLVKKCIP